MNWTLWEYGRADAENGKWFDCPDYDIESYSVGYYSYRPKPIVPIVRDSWIVRIMKALRLR